MFKVEKKNVDRKIENNLNFSTWFYTKACYGAAMTV